MSNRTIEAVLRLSAKLGSMAGFQRLSKELAGVDQKAKRFNRSQALLTKGNNALYAAAVRYAAPAALAYGATRAVTSYATLERRLERIGITADASQEQIAGAMDQMRNLAQDIAVPVGNVVDGYESLVASGKTAAEAMALLPAVARTAHAADADFKDMATTADAISGSFEIAADQMENAFDILAKGGKMGKFELKDMAAELPSLAPAFAALGYRGAHGLRMLTSALQVVRMETGQSGEAATAFMDVITKMTSETVTNNFKKFGVNIRKELDDAVAGGEDRLLAFIRLSREAVKGDLSKLPLLFTDKQMQIGMRALINRTQTLTDGFKELGDAAGTVDGDINRLSKNAQADLDRLSNSWDRLWSAVGQGLVDNGATNAMDAIAERMEGGQKANRDLKRGHEIEGRTGFWEQTLWNATATEEDKKRVRSLVRIEAANAAYRPRLPSIDGATSTGTIPVPTFRPGGPLPFAGPTGYGPEMPRFPQQFGPNLPTGSLDGGDVSVRPGQHVAALDGILANLERGLESGAGKIAKGGADAGDEMAQRLKTAAEQAASVFGDIVASKIRSASVSVTVRGSGSDIGAGGGGL